MYAHHLSVSRTARYYLVGEPGPHVTSLWFALHGYGQLAAEFAEEFQGLTDEKTLIVVPEALNRYYRKGTGGKVGATWMTREDRLQDMQDYVGYLNKLYRTIIKELSPEAKVQVLGFSQGVATACRWLESGQIPCRHLVLWAGTFPEDLDKRSLLIALPEMPITLVAGWQDQYVTEEAIGSLVRDFYDVGQTAQVLRYTGGHEVKNATLKELGLIGERSVKPQPDPLLS
jgi:predicted esterase